MSGIHYKNTIMDLEIYKEWLSDHNLVTYRFGTNSLGVFNVLGKQVSEFPELTVSTSFFRATVNKLFIQMIKQVYFMGKYDSLSCEIVKKMTNFIEDEKVTLLSDNFQTEELVCLLNWVKNADVPDMEENLYKIFEMKSVKILYDTMTICLRNKIDKTLKELIQFSCLDKKSKKKVHNIGSFLKRFFELHNIGSLSGFEVACDYDNSGEICKERLTGKYKSNFITRVIKDHFQKTQYDHFQLLVCPEFDYFDHEFLRGIKYAKSHNKDYEYGFGRIKISEESEYYLMHFKCCEFKNEQYSRLILCNKPIEYIGIVNQCILFVKIKGWTIAAVHFPSMSDISQKQFDKVNNMFAELLNKVNQFNKTIIIGDMNMPHFNNEYCQRSFRHNFKLKEDWEKLKLYLDNNFVGYNDITGIHGKIRSLEPSINVQCLEGKHYYDLTRNTNSRDYNTDLVLIQKPKLFNWNFIRNMNFYYEFYSTYLFRLCEYNIKPNKSEHPFTDTIPYIFR